MSVCVRSGAVPWVHFWITFSSTADSVSLAIKRVSSGLQDSPPGPQRNWSLWGCWGLTLDLRGDWAAMGFGSAAEDPPYVISLADRTCRLSTHCRAAGVGPLGGLGPRLPENGAVELPGSGRFSGAGHLRV